VGVPQSESIGKLLKVLHRHCDLEQLPEKRLESAALLEVCPWLITSHLFGAAVFAF
jgi:hypothetical protein